MKRVRIAAICVALSLSNAGVASENPATELVALDKNTFVIVDNSTDGLQTVKLFKVDDNKLTLADAIQIGEHKINFTPSYEVQKSIIQTK